MESETRRNLREPVGRVRATMANCEAGDLWFCLVRKPFGDKRGAPTWLLCLLDFSSPGFDRSSLLKRYRAEMYKLYKVGRTNVAKRVGI